MSIIKESCCDCSFLSVAFREATNTPNLLWPPLVAMMEVVAVVVAVARPVVVVVAVEEVATIADTVRRHSHSSHTLVKNSSSNFVTKKALSNHTLSVQHEEQRLQVASPAPVAARHGTCDCWQSLPVLPKLHQALSPPSTMPATTITARTAAAATTTTTIARAATAVVQATALPTPAH